MTKQTPLELVEAQPKSTERLNQKKVVEVLDAMFDRGEQLTKTPLELARRQLKQAQDSLRSIPQWDTPKLKRIAQVRDAIDILRAQLAALI